MMPINGFFEYGIAALLGAAGMIAFSVWMLIEEGSHFKGEQSADDESETKVPISYKKAA
jgi:hypothetical protein